MRPPAYAELPLPQEMEPSAASSSAANLAQAPAHHGHDGGMHQRHGSVAQHWGALLGKDAISDHCHDLPTTPQTPAPTAPEGGPAEPHLKQHKPRNIVSIADKHGLLPTVRTISKHPQPHACYQQPLVGEPTHGL
jgi:hypothetical protein